MFVLPKNNVQFSDGYYWDSFFQKRGIQPFEWYGDYTELCNILHKYIKVNDKILVPGCGNSSLSAVLYDVGYKDITNIDVSQVVIDQMKETYCKTRPDLLYLHMDVTQTTFPDKTFTCILDKGTLDSLFSDNNSISKERVTQFFLEIERILKDCGRYVCFSLLQDYILKFLLDYFIAKNWFIRICRCTEIEKKSTDENILPIFSVVCIKMKNTGNNMESVLEISENNEGARRVSKEELCSFVKLAQNSEIICNGLNKTAITTNDGEAVLDVHRSAEEPARYLVLLKDKLTDGHLTPEMRKFGVFIVPKGREREWIFGDPEGREYLRDACDVSRLILIYFCPDHVYPALPEVQDEVRSIVLRLVPASLKQPTIPFLAFGESNQNKEEIFKGNSTFSGDYTVSDVEESDGTFSRQLIFMEKPKLIQSEAKLKTVKIKEGNQTVEKKVIDYSCICNDYHLQIFISIALVSNAKKESNARILVIGLGGGVLSNHIARLFPNVVLDVIELDPEVLTVAKECFELVENEKLKVYVQDGLVYLKDAALKGEKYDAIVFDADNKDITSPVSCPPKQFLEADVLNNVKSCLNKRGVFVLNLACRSVDTQNAIGNNLRKYFEKVTCLKQLGGDINEVILCWQKSAEIYVSDLTDAADFVKKIVEEQSLDATVELLDITKTMKSIKI